MIPPTARGKRMVDEKNNPNPSSEGPGFKSVLVGISRFRV
jgi:hypothetical protein